VVSDAELGGFPVCTVVPVFELGSHRIFTVVGGWFSLRFGCVGVSNLPPSPKWRGGTSQTRAEASEGGGGDQYCIAEERRKNRKQLSTSAD
jgi:hypothetical protein